ncbi:DUF802 domain-containing protein [Rhodoferax sp. PAMC 29310]|uniref:DUF802 domain-containing protein n=1 Tax=Rhodoferax sp. PAMC 29310 TaxID=2822760 RepID=UPI001B32ED32|nr:DUF802 domain-containing protein [Rhodoferax sp. PAMC 29310]
MNKYLFAIAFGLGAAAVAWVGSGFIGTNLLALTMTALIGAVFVFGAWELRQFRQATSALASALAATPAQLSDLGDWLSGVPASLRTTVRLRVEGERVGLPGPALTPYLVGLLVMLGMLGTFLGMVVTLNGAVFALEGTTDLTAIRAALAAPIKGLGLAFGTSVAGVAASAMLGLMSALSRRERVQAAQALDSQIATTLRGFSMVHQRQETFKALQAQSQALPEVVTHLRAMMTQMERMNEQLNERLVGNQDQFHKDVKGVYTDLAVSVDMSLRNSLSQSAQIAGESLQPAVDAALNGIAAQAKLMHERMVDTVQLQLDGLTERFGATASTVAATWTGALASQEQANAKLVGGVERTLGAFADTFEQRSGALVTSVNSAYATLQADQASLDAQRLQAWTQSLQSVGATLQSEWQGTSEKTLAQQQEICSTLTQAVQRVNEQTQASAAQTLADTTRLITSAEDLMHSRMASEADWTTQHQERMAALLSRHEQASTMLVSGVERTLGAFADTFDARSGALVASVGTAYASLQTDQTAGDAQRLQLWTQSLEGASATLQREWQSTADKTLAQQQQICTTLTEAVQSVTEQAQTRSAQTLGDATRLITSAEELMRSRLAAEAEWIAQHNARMEALSTQVRTELGALRAEEAQRGDAAVARLAELQTALTGHLTTLGTALEDPITRLIETASEAPRATADVIGQLRKEISSSVARDNELLEERSRIMATLNTLLESINHASVEQRAVIDSLVATSAVALNTAGSEFSDKVGAEAVKLSDIAAHVTSSAVEVSSLSEAFGFAVNSFNEANEKLIANLQRIEGAMDKSMARSDDQLAYYVAQAREIIDLSLMSQKEIFEELRQLPGKQAAPAEEVA